MKLPKNFWTYAKAGLLTFYVIVAFVTGPEPIDSGDSPPPFWLAIIPIVFLGLFLPPYLRACKATEHYLRASPWPAFPFSPFRDPFPFCHLGVWALFAAAVPQTYHALTPYNHDQLVTALVMWSCGAGALLGITGAKRGLMRRVKYIEPADGQASSASAPGASSEEPSSQLLGCLIRGIRQETHQVTTTKFQPPEGTNFNCRDFVPIVSLSRDLCKITAFLQDRYAHVSLLRFDDWWQHDGLHFEKGALDLHGLLSMVDSSKAILESMQGDDEVRVGIAPSDRKWYLRFYVTWDDEEDFLEGDYDVTLPLDVAGQFRQEVIPALEANIQEEPSQAYFQRIIV